MISASVSVAATADTKRPASAATLCGWCWFDPTWLVHHQGLEPGTP